MISSPQRYSRCFISAPYGLDLGMLPLLLGQRQIAWNWSENTQIGMRYASTIHRCDFVIAILNGSQSDQRVLYEVGLAEGMKKPVFMISSSKRVGRVARSIFSLVDIKLKEIDALAFHLDAFLLTPHETILERDRFSGGMASVEPREPVIATQQFHSQLEARVYTAILEVGGSAILEPKSENFAGRPDILMWLGSQDAELFDPAVIEIKSRLDPEMAKRVEQQLLDFIYASGVGCGFILTEQEPNIRRRHLSPHVFWLSVDKFVELAQDGDLGRHIRSLRNRAAHGAV